MTKQEELTYLFGILSEASKWTASADDNRDLVRMEVEERIHNLINGVVPVPDENGLIQSSIHPDNLPAESEALTGADYQVPESEKLNDHLPDPKKAAKAVSEWKSKRVRCQENGHPVWRPLCQCHKEKLFPDNPESKKFKWVWDGPQNKKAQEEEAMWAEHEAGNAE